MITADHPSNTKGRVPLYYKEYLALTRRIDICKLNECIGTEITVNIYVSCRVFADYQVKIRSS